METPRQKEARKAKYLSQVIRMTKGEENIEEIIKEASEKFEEENKDK